MGVLLYERYNAAMLRRAKRYLPGRYDVEDVVSDCWVRLLPKVEALMAMDEAAQASYILTTVQNTAIDYYRKQARHCADTDRVENSVVGDNKTDEYERFCLSEEMSSLLAMLPPRIAQIVCLKADGASNEEISESLDISQSTVRVYWLRGKARLRLLAQTLNG